MSLDAYMDILDIVVPSMFAAIKFCVIWVATYLAAIWFYGSGVQTGFYLPFNFTILPSPEFETRYTNS